MASSAYIYLIGTYLMGFAFFTYFCMIADPDESRLAYLLAVKLPNQMTSKISSIIGPKLSSYAADAFDYSLLLFYILIVGGSWFIIFTFVYPWIDTCSTVSYHHKYIGVVVFLSCFQSWRCASGKSPGIITAHTISKYDNYPYDNLLYVQGRICPTVGIHKLARSKFDRHSGVHIARFDHFCGWLHNPIGEENYRWFLLFLVVHVGMCMYGFTICAYLFLDEIEQHKLWSVTFVNSVTHEEFTADKWVVFQFLFQRHQMVAGLFVLMGAMAITLGLFLGYHCWITSIGMTTNEAAKWTQVKKWHKYEVRRFNEALKAGVIAPDIGITSMPQVTDGDVTCTGGATPQLADNMDREPIIDPGPMPKNIYHLGFLENWKAVLFPRSLRSSSLERYRQSLKEISELPASTSAPQSTKLKTG